ncbi:short chain dehydrogenase [Caballeronia arationis]|jgi:NAD(P)-dependent dehydrogenase (short-subunit alcohol dehydrogenase family)|uniref:NAD(P)-dependent dehydrogenase, short-chain alcohol dehydrogenase family n=1 Tax=Caballeronia arationis TaxID=1777142 RepID=A0A7Z7I3S1_9BURK|nr:SDR family oxidoreductase [Caballeronia arationis]SAK98828.1 short chain dehydrogenase [Caballeronia arationis]SOE56304.1 NAD(P)-dependent dehydrogenase, short-chain alcohol dehydrogenase family [Caballeronia arationis]
MSKPFEGRVFWITGAFGALGAATARRLALAGANVIASSRNVDTQLFAELPRVVPLSVDVADDRSVRSAFAQIEERFGRLDGLVTSTNVAAFGDFLDLTDDDWQRVIDAKLLGSVRPIRAALPRFIAQGHGAIVAISGRGGIAPPPNHFPGSSVNAALDLLVQGLGRRYGPLGVRVNAVAPGPIRSPRFDSMATTQAATEPTRLTALDGPGTPEDVAAAVAYLLSDDARFVTGTRLYVDGGGPPYA